MIYNIGLRSEKPWYRSGFVFVVGAVVLVALYLIIAGAAPRIPGAETGNINYPLMVFYRSSPWFHVSIVVYVIVTIVLLVSRRVVSSAHLRRVSVLLLVMSCAALLLGIVMNWGRDFRHHDSLQFDGGWYYLGSSASADPSRILYMVYYCENSRILCRRVAIPHGGIDPSALPGGTYGDRTAAFVTNELGVLGISVHEGVFPVFPIP